MAQGERDAQILAAEALKQKAFLEAEALERTAEAKAKSLEMVSKAINSKAQGNHAASYLLSEQYIKSLASLSTSQGSKTVFMPFEASKLLSSVGTFGALAKDMLGGSGSKGKEAPNNKP